MRGEGGGSKPGSGNYLYKTTCLRCGWYVNKGLPFKKGIHEHLDICEGPVVLTILRKESYANSS